VSALEDEDRLLLAGVCDDGAILHEEACDKLFSVAGRCDGPIDVPPEVSAALEDRTERLQEIALTKISERNAQFFEEEIDKLERWADDLKHNLEVELKDIDAEIKQATKEAKLALTLDDRLSLHRRKKDLEAERSKKRRELYEAQDEIDKKKEELISGVEARLGQSTALTTLFLIRWSIT
jgi:adenine-specific DNA-methyltransferase